MSQISDVAFKKQLERLGGSDLEHAIKQSSYQIKEHGDSCNAAYKGHVAYHRNRRKICRDILKKRKFDKEVNKKLGGKNHGKKKGRVHARRSIHIKKTESSQARDDNKVKKTARVKVKERHSDELRDSGREPKLKWDIRVNKRLQTWTYFGLWLNDEFVANICLPNHAYEDFNRRMCRII